MTHLDTLPLHLTLRGQTVAEMYPSQEEAYAYRLIIKKYTIFMEN
jgi:hypothetical protein